MKSTQSVSFAVTTLAVIALVGGAATASAESVSGNASLNANIGVPMMRVNGEMSGQGHGPKDDRGFPMKMGDRKMPEKRGISGQVTAINGTTLTVNSKTMKPLPKTTGAASSTAAVIYTVNASNAVVLKNNATTTLSSIAVGDNVMIEGSVSGTTVIATKIHAGMLFKGGDRGDFGEGKGFGTSTFEGNGQPVIAGTITAVNGSTVTLTNKSNVTYTVDVSAAKITKNGSAETASNLTVGSNIVVQGTVNGTSITASSVLDGGAKTNTGTAVKHGFFSNIGYFFTRLFGF